MQLDKITGKVRLTKNMKLKPNQSLKVKAKSSNPLNTKRVNVIIEQTDDEEGSYTIPAYTYLKSNSRSVHVGLHNMSCHTVTLHKGTVIAELSPANAILKMLAPKLASCQLEFAKNQGPKSNKLEFADSTNSQPKLTQERRDKLFSKYDFPQYEEVCKHLDEMLRMGTIRRSNCPWASAVVLVHKKDGALRFCIDLRKLNERSVKDAYSLP